MIFVNDSNGRTVYHDPVWKELTGQEIGQALGRGWLDRVHIHDRSMVEDTHCQAIDAACEYFIQYRLLMPNDESRWVRVGAQASVGPSDRTFIGFLGSLVILPSVETGSYRAYGQIYRDTMHRVGDTFPPVLDADRDRSEVPEGAIPARAPHLRQRIQSAIGLSRLARRHVGVDGGYRTRVTLDMALIELAKEMERLKSGS